MDSLIALIKSGSRRALSKALTLTESTNKQHQILALELLNRLQNNPEPKDTSIQSNVVVHHPPSLPFRIGFTGPPGAGKSSLIETLGCKLIEEYRNKVAVLAIDPSSDLSGGSILGDKTRMAKLSSLDSAFVRPTPSRGTLGGVARSTSEAILICSAAGYDHIFVETVGVGQSEIAVKDLVDCMVLVLSPVGGDELQSIKRGITEFADIVVVNKADGPNRHAALRAVAAFRGTTHLRKMRRQSWAPVVLAVSAHSGEGVDVLHEHLEEYYSKMKESGELDEVREQQYAKAAWTACEEMILERLRSDRAAKRVFDDLLDDIRAGKIGPRHVAKTVVDSCYYLLDDEGGRDGGDE